MTTPTHTRIRMFNTKDTYPNQSLNNDLCQAVRAGNTVYVRGRSAPISTAIWSASVTRLHRRSRR